METWAKVLGDGFSGLRPLSSSLAPILGSVCEQESPHLDIYPPDEEECTVAGPVPTSTSPELSTADLQEPAAPLGQEHTGWAGDAEDGTQPGG